MATTAQQAAEPKARAVHHVRLGRISATIWEAETESRARYSVSLERTYRLPPEQRSGQGDPGWRRTSFYGRDDCFLVGEAARQAANWIFQEQRRDQQTGQNDLTTSAEEAAPTGEQHSNADEIPF